VTAHAGSGIVRACYVLGPEAPPLDTLAGALDELRREAQTAEGSLILQAAPAALKARLDAWGEPGDALRVMRRLKAEFDPQGLCNPGRFLGGI
jgi:glycolate oxidase FAD binding subunit